MVICLQGADLHMAQLMPLPLTVSCFSKIHIGLPVWYLLTRVVLEKGPLFGCVCVCVYLVNEAIIKHRAKADEQKRVKFDKPVKLATICLYLTASILLVLLLTAGIIDGVD